MVEQHGKTLVPQIRFFDFTDPWEQRKLGEFGSVAMCKRIYKEQTSEQGDVPFFKIGTFGANPDAFISNELFEDFKRIYPYPTPGTLLISAAGSIGRVVEYQGEKAYFQDSNIVWLEHDHRLNDAFLKPLYSRIEWGLEGSTIKRLYNKDLLSAEVTVPGGREQEEIGQFFAKLDNLITLHQRKYDKLCVLKKSMLDKMFPKGGSLYPEIRFAGFADPWEQHKLGELCSFSKGCGYSKNNLRDQGTPIILYGRLYTNYETQIHSVDTFVDPLENSVYTEGGEVIVPASGETAEDISIASVVEKPGIILGGDLNVITPSAVVNPVFLALELSYGKPHFDLAKRAQGKSVVHIHNEDIANVFFDRPCIAEQRRIGEFFDRLDSLITLHQRKLELLRNIKKSMLDKMFV